MLLQKLQKILSFCLGKTGQHSMLFEESLLFPFALISYPVSVCSLFILCNTTGVCSLVAVIHVLSMSSSCEGTGVFSSELTIIKNM